MTPTMMDKILEILKGLAALLTAFFIGKRSGESEVDQLEKDKRELQLRMAIDEAEKKVIEDSSKLSDSDAIADMASKGRKINKNK